MKQYFDKNGKEIKPGMTLEHIDGDKDLVLSVGESDMGFNASNKSHVEYMEGYNQLIYPLHQFDLREWKIVEE